MRSRDDKKNSPFEDRKDDEGFSHISFPGVGEDEFREIVIKLKNQGVSMIGVDTALTEKKIMKLANLLETPLERFDEDEITEKDVVSQIKKALKSEYADPTSKFWAQIADIIGDYEEQDEYDKGWYNESKEDKVRKVIRKMIRQ